MMTKIAVARKGHYLRHVAQVKLVENILKGSLDLIPSPSSSVKIQIMGGKVCFGCKVICKGKTLLGNVNKHLKTKSLLTSTGNVKLSRQ